MQNCSTGTLRVPFWPGDVAHAFQRDQHRNAVGRRRGVAQVAAETGPALDLDTADERDRVHQARIRPGNRFVLIDQAAGHRGADDQPLGGVTGELVDLGDVLDIDEQIDVAPPLADLHDDVRAAGEDAGAISLVVQESRGVGDGGRGGVGDIFHEAIILPSPQMSEANLRSHPASSLRLLAGLQHLLFNPAT